MQLIGGEPFLFSVDGSKIMKYKISTSTFKNVYTSNQSVTFISYDNTENKLLWLENNQDTIFSLTAQEYRGNYIRTKSVLIGQLTSATSFVYDWISRTIIWCSEAERKVTVTSLNGVHYTLLQLPESMIPSSIAVDPFRQ